MVDYITQTGMRQTFGTGRVNKTFSTDSGTSLDTGTFSRMRQTAQAFVDGDLGQKYTTPFTSGSVPIQITKITEVVVMRMALASRRTNVPPELEAYMELWMEYLQRIRDGSAVLTGQTSVQHQVPFVVNKTGIPKFRDTVFDTEGEQVNTDIVPDDEGGELDTW